MGEAFVLEWAYTKARDDLVAAGDLPLVLRELPLGRTGTVLPDLRHPAYFFVVHGQARDPRL